MTRVTPKMVRLAFLRFLKATGRRQAADIHDVGGFVLDSNFVYGGYRVECICNEFGATSSPFSDLRRSNREMYDTLNFAIRAVEMADAASQLA